MEIKKIICFIFLIFFFIKNINAAEQIPKDAIEPYCEGNLKNVFVDDLKLENISIRILNSQKWNENLLRLHLNYEKKRNEREHKDWIANFRITNDFKKKYKANVFVKYKNQNVCKFKAKIRLTGDLWLHLDWKKGSPISSIHVQLLNGHIFNITKFKLFLAKARYGSNEVFVSNLFKELGFLSPKTFFLKTKINNVDVNYIFQEDIKKELIEKALFREGPLLEGDERFTVQLPEKEKINFKSINYARISNNKFLKKDTFNSSIGIEALSNLNKLYSHNHRYKFNENIIDPFEDLFYLFTDKFFKKRNIEILNTFESLSYALDTIHGLSMDDRRYYYDTFNKFYLPIYYDGKSLILNKKQRLNFESGKKIKSLSNEAILGANQSIKLIENLNIENFLFVLKNAGMKITLKELEITMNKIKNRLKKMANYNLTNRNFVLKERFYDEMSKYNNSIKFIFTNNKDNQIFICNFIFKDCEILKFNKNEYFKILNDGMSQRFTELKGKLKTKNDYVFISDYYIKDLKKFNYLNDNWNKMKIADTTIEFKDVKIIVDDINKTISIDQLSEEGKAIFLGGKLNKWKILFNGLNVKIIKTQKNNLTNPSNLTGCLSFYEVEFNSTSISSINSFCEDSVNIIRSKGYINNIFIKNSLSDSLDVDFSNITINNLKVNNSKNDCLDFSFGNYIINETKLSNCGDKAISVGEKSNMKIKNINVNESFIGVASKDSSKTEIINGNFFKSDICLSAYRKKVEFSGGKLVLHNITCESKKNYFSKDSKVIIN